MLKDIPTLFNDYLHEQNLCLEEILKNNSSINNIIGILIDARNSGKKIFTFGNGGSASTASHFVSDLLKTTITKDDKRFIAISLVDNFAVNSAWANDVSYDDIFIEQLKNFLTDGDIVIAFSGSGTSINVTKALEYAKTKGAITIGFTGIPGGKFPKICDHSYLVPSNNMLTIESFHIMICHGIVFSIRELGDPIFKYE
jgi:D-sedoheptulose 7-phosphate isomerase|tara:strand:+ start:35 stop:631 length:597 start_codon:yes stop_codon:yes gene_type:complete